MRLEKESSQIIKDHVQRGKELGLHSDDKEIIFKQEVMLSGLHFSNHLSCPHPLFLGH